MSASISLGRVWGIPIGLHWSMFLIFALLSWSLASNYFPSQYRQLGQGQLWLLAVVTSVLFFASILLHELGHAWVALREKLPVTGITLFIFGGVAQIGATSRSPGVEFRVAVGGPIVSLALAVLFGLLARLGGGVAELAAPSQWLARVNLLLLLFNLIPGYPLDGGRVLRAAVWYFTGSERTGWRVAAFSGQLVSFGMIGIGAYLVFSGSVADGIWLIFIGWFLQNATAAEQAAATLETQLRGTTVAQAMRIVDEPRVPSRLKLRQLVNDYVLPTGQRCFLVVDDDVPRGLVTLRDLTEVEQDRWDWVSVAEVMRPWSRLTVVQSRSELMAALQLMDDSRVGQLPVLDGERLVGLLTREEIIHFLRLRAEIGVPRA
jgi:Zn-dependent protease/CBS domain-containing protein